MDERNGSWFFSPKSKVPDWIKQLEGEIERTISEYQQTL
jgi:hypothetical protein